MVMLKRVLDRLLKLRWVRITLDALKMYGQHHCFYMAAAISFYSIIAIGPLSFLAFWALRQFLGSSDVAQAEVAHLLAESLPRDAARSIVESLTHVQGFGSGLAAWVSLGALAWSGISFYESLQAIFSLAWGGTARAFLSSKLRALAAFVGAGVFVLLTILLTGAMAAVNAGAERTLGVYIGPVLFVIGWLLPYLLSILVFFLIYKFMPNALVPWRIALGVAIPVGILWEVGKRVFANATISSFQLSFYGPVAWFIALMVWIYWSSNIVLLGAEFGAAIRRQQERFYGETG
jgi:membrane protein